MKKPVLHRGGGHLDPVGQHEAALKGAGGDAAVKIDARVVGLGLAAADDKLPVLGGDRQVILGETGDGQRDAERVGRQVLDVVGGIAFWSVWSKPRR